MEFTSPPWLVPEAPESQPEGMLRISDGNTFQVIWPVHLAGWLALGWRLDWPQPAGAGLAPGQEAGGPLMAPVITALLPRFQERCHPFEPSIRGLEDMTNAPIQRGR